MRGNRSVLAVLVLFLVLPALAGETTRISVGPDGEQSDGASSVAAISNSGRFVSFHSAASNLVTGDTNGERDVFVFDRRKGVVSRVSVSTEGDQGNDETGGGGMSLNGRYVTFYSFATNLVPGDTNGARDVFLHDRRKATTTRVSVSSDGVQGNEGSAWSAISGNGRFVAFSSGASNLVPGDTNGVSDIFVYDRRKRTTTRVSVSSTGAQSYAGASWISLSKNGRYILFRTAASTLVHGDTNGMDDLFLHDRRRGTTTRVSVGPDGEQGDGACIEGRLSANGRAVLFSSTSTNLLPGNPDGLQHVYYLDMRKGTLRRVSVTSAGVNGNGDCYHPRLSPCGRYASFISSGNNLVPDNTNGLHDAFLHHLRRGTTTRLALVEGGQSDGAEWRPYLSRAAKYVTFYSDASNLVIGDTNDQRDVFLHRR